MTECCISKKIRILAHILFDMFYKKLIFVSVLLLNISIEAFSTTITLSGSDRNYANTEIAFYKTSDPIVKSDVLIAKTIADSAGQFTLSIELSQTTYIYCYQGIYKYFLYAEPLHIYNLILPPKTILSDADRQNPFFEYAPVHLVFYNMNDTDLNFSIRSFDDAWVPYFNRFAQNIYSRTSRNMIDTTLASLNKPYIGNNNAFFNTYKDYKNGLLRHLAYQQKSKAVWKEFFYNKPVLIDNPGYAELFNQVFDKYFFYFSLDPKGKALADIINKQKSLHALKTILNTDSILYNDSLKELVILKNLHDEFYKANYSRAAMLVILDTLIVTSLSAKYKSIGLEIREKVTKLIAGFEPPAFELTDINGKKYSLHDFKGKYLYLCFCSCNSYSCLKEFDALQAVANTHKEKLNVVTIFVGDEILDIKNFITKSKYNFLFLSSIQQPEIVKKYDIRAYPTYYFIGRDGKLINSPAPSPSEGFEVKWYEHLKNIKDL